MLVGANAEELASLILDRSGDGEHLPNVQSTLISKHQPVLSPQFHT